MRRSNVLLIALVATNLALIGLGLVGLARAGTPATTPPAASAPLLVSYRGTVADGSGLVNGTKDLTFRVFAQEAGGAPVWVERHAAVPIAAGQFSVMLGATAVPSGTMPLSLFAQPERWLEIVVESTVLTPRQRFTSVPYALNALQATTAQTATVALSVPGLDPSVGSLPTGAVVWFRDGQAPAGFTRIPGMGQNIGAWKQAADMPADITSVFCPVSTGTELLCWRAWTSGEPAGARYNPTTDSWARMATLNAPEGRERWSAVWTGQEMIIWGGRTSTGVTNTGARYNPATDSWAPMSTLNAPEGRSFPSAVWTGQEMIVWGGQTSTGIPNTGARYNPVTDTWAPISTDGAPLGAQRVAGIVWTGQEMIVWNGLDRSGRYNPTTDTWRAMSRVPVAIYSYGPGIWTGSVAVFMGGPFIDVYNPATDSWQRLARPSSGFSSSGSPLVTKDGRYLLTYSGVYDLSTLQQVVTWETLNFSLMAVGEELIAAPPLTMEVAPEYTRILRHRLDLVFPYVKD